MNKLTIEISNVPESMIDASKEIFAEHGEPYTGNLKLDFEDMVMISNGDNAFDLLKSAYAFYLTAQSYAERMKTVRAVKKIINSKL